MRLAAWDWAATGATAVAGRACRAPHLNLFREAPDAGSARAVGGQLGDQRGMGVASQTVPPNGTRVINAGPHSSYEHLVAADFGAAPVTATRHAPGRCGEGVAFLDRSGRAAGDGRLRGDTDYVLSQRWDDG